MADWEQQLQQILNDPQSMGRIMQMAQQLSGGGAGEAPPPEQTASPDPELDTATVARLLPLIREWRKPNTQASQLLYALQPYLKPEKQGKVEQALRLAHIIHIGKKAVTDGGLSLV